MLEKEQNKKIINNAISAYLMIFVSGLFLFNKTNLLLNNDFVKKHTKSALLIHLGFLITYVIFITNGLFAGISIVGVPLNFILSTIFSIFLLGVLLYGIYCASKGALFAVGDIIRVSSVKKIAGIHGEEVQFNEREKLNILLAYIPFVGFYNFPKHQNNEFVVHATRLNLFITIILILLYNFGFVNLAILSILIYLIYVVFISINLFTTEKIIEIKLHDIFAPEKKYYFTKAIFRYLGDYKNGEKLQKLSTYYSNILAEVEQSKKEDNDTIIGLPDLRFPKFLIYIPFLNIVYNFGSVNKYSSHIRNGSVLTIIFMILIAILHIFSLNYGFLYLFLVIISYGIGYIQTSPSYKMPYVYMWYSICKHIFGKTKMANEKYNVEKNITLKVEEK